MGLSLIGWVLLGGLIFSVYALYIAVTTLERKSVRITDCYKDGKKIDKKKSNALNYIVIVVSLVFIMAVIFYIVM